MKIKYSVFFIYFKRVTLFKFVLWSRLWIGHTIIDFEAEVLPENATLLIRQELINRKFIEPLVVSLFLLPQEGNI